MDELFDASNAHLLGTCPKCGSELVSFRKLEEELQRQREHEAPSKTDPEPDGPPDDRREPGP